MFVTPIDPCKQVYFAIQRKKIQLDKLLTFKQQLNSKVLIYLRYVMLNLLYFIREKQTTPLKFSIPYS